MKVYEIGVYNSFVRDTLRNGNKLPETNTISSEFEDTLYFERVAESKEHARERAGYEWPSSLHYVIDYVSKVRG